MNITKNSRKIPKPFFEEFFKFSSFPSSFNISLNKGLEEVIRKEPYSNSRNYENNESTKNIPDKNTQDNTKNKRHI